MTGRLGDGRHSKPIFRKVRPQQGLDFKPQGLVGNTLAIEKRCALPGWKICRLQEEILHTRPAARIHVMRPLR